MLQATGKMLIVAVLGPATLWGCGASTPAGTPVEPAKPAKLPKAATACTKYAAPDARGRGRGTFRRPFRTVNRLAHSLRPGQTGCLRRGTFEEDVTLRRGGTSKRAVTLRSFPGERVTLRGRLVLANSADWVTIRDLHLDGRNRPGLPSPTVNGEGATFTHNEVTNFHSAICFALGNPGRGRAVGTRIVANRIHHCGRVPPTNHDHGIYVEDALNTFISRNWIHDNADRGIQLYPNAQHTVIVRNVIHGNGTGIIFSGSDGTTSDDTLVETNLITASDPRYNVESYYPPGNPVGRVNVVRRNCVGGGAKDDGAGGIGEPIGFTLVDNILGQPAFVDPVRGDLRLRRGSPCRGIAASTLPGPRVRRRRSSPALR